jgi:hypothetical protein
VIHYEYEGVKQVTDKQALEYGSLFCKKKKLDMNFNRQKHLKGRFTFKTLTDENTTHNPEIKGAGSPNRLGGNK